LWQSKGFGPRAGLFPWAVGAPVLALAIALLVFQLAGKDREPPPEPSEITPEETARRTTAILGWIVGYLAAIWLLGFAIGGTLCTFLSFIGSRERWPVVLAGTVIVGALVYAVFVRALHVPFPPPQLFTWMGIG